MVDADPDEDLLYGLMHARHLAEEPDGSILHRDPDGSLHDDAQEWRLLGIFSSRAGAEARLAEARLLPGFDEDADCFEITVLGVDYDLWTGGYVTVPEGGEQ